MSGRWEPGGAMFETIARFMAEGRRWVEAEQAYVNAATGFTVVPRDFADVLDQEPEEAARWSRVATPESLRQSAETLERMTADQRNRFLEQSALADQMRKFMEGP